jgi:hypothetical protein
MRLNRRQILQASLAGGAAGTFLGFGSAPRSASVDASTAAVSAASATADTLDGFELLRRAVRLGQRIQLGSEARADVPATPNEDAVIVTIKVMNHIHTPLCFKLGALTADETATQPYTGANLVPWSAKFSNANTLSLLLGRGLDAPSDIPRFRRLRMNRWWASILNDGRVETGSIPTVLGATDVGPFPAENEVAIQVALGVSQTDLSLNHSFKNCALPASTDPNRGGDLAYHCAKQGIIKSPLGLVCLNMGNVVETTDSIGNVPNRVVANDQVTVAALGRTVDSYVRVVGQAVGLGLVDEALVSKFDAFVGGDSTIADELKKSRSALKSALASMATASAIERARHQMPGIADAANLQLIGSAGNQVAQAEFISQCKFVQRALDVPGRPFRNFTLFLNVVDLDGAAVDTTSASAGSIAQGANPYSYVEGMRQLGVGLNMLAQVIKKHRNVYVVVVSEGGRSATRGDSKASHAIVMGPGGAGNLKDFLYANDGAINSTSDEFVADPNNGNGQLTGPGQRKPSGQLVANEGGTTVDDHMTTGAILNGLVRHLETKRGLAPTTAGLGKFVRLQTA